MNVHNDLGEDSRISLFFFIFFSNMPMAKEWMNP